jgi:UDP-glucose 4-epimerase
MNPLLGRHNPYNVTKACSELWGMSYYENCGVDFVALRYAGPYGLGMRAESSTYLKWMVENAAKGVSKMYSGKDLDRVWDGFEWIKLSPERFLRKTYGYVKDLAAANLLAFDIKSESLKTRIYNMTGSEESTLSQLAEAVEKASGVKCKLSPDLFEMEKKGLGRPNIRSIELARKELGYIPKYNLQEGVADYLRDYKEYLEWSKNK